MRTLLKIAIFGLILIGGVQLWYRSSLAPAGESAIREVVQIPSGASAEQIGQLLKEKGLIRSALAFRWAASLRGVADRLQAGSYVLHSSMSVSDILSSLLGKVADEAIITIPEGFTVRDIDALLAEKGLITAGQIEECARTCSFSSFDFLPSGARLAQRGGRVEGYLYPDTYFIDATSFIPEAFLERLLSTFRTRVIDEYGSQIAASKRSLHQIVTMASLVEEETRTADERPIVSGILWKRFDEGMGLGVDAAVRYIIGKPTAAITVDDLEVDSPYNLRKYAGLPPGPIANPSLASIKATITPKTSEYWYYLHGSDGMIRYAVTNDEHNENKAKYLR